MSFFNKKKILVTHNGTFHADDLFATATLSILYKNDIRIIRTRDQSLIDFGDVVYDVGGVYDPINNRFDHHQKGGAGSRPNGIPYSSFGLVWKKYGEQICGNREIANKIDVKIVQPIDASDNGVDISKPIFKDVFFYTVEAIFLSEVPTWKESNENIDKIFKKQVKKIIELLKREIKIAQDDIEGIKMIMKLFGESDDKRVIISDTDFPRYLFQDTLSRLEEPLYLVYPSSHGDVWKVEAIKKSPETMESRKLFPEAWRGIMGSSGKLKEITGVTDAQFCHQSGFFLTVSSKEGALELARKALLVSN
jgi:uncharacterized UPF0160 family protein